MSAASNINTSGSSSTGSVPTIRPASVDEMEGMVQPFDETELDSIERDERFKALQSDELKGILDWIRQNPQTSVRQKAAESDTLEGKLETINPGSEKVEDSTIPTQKRSGLISRVKKSFWNMLGYSTTNPKQ